MCAGGVDCLCVLSLLIGWVCCCVFGCVFVCLVVRACVIVVVEVVVVG